MNNRAFGAIGEEHAARHLAMNGFTLLVRNFRVGRMGEIDIIARENGYLCFIEVKSRSGDRYGTPSEAVSHKKRNTISMLAQMYMQDRKYKDAVRFDVIEVYMDKELNVKNINHIRNAF